MPHLQRLIADARRWSQGDELRKFAYVFYHDGHVSVWGDTSHHGGDEFCADLLMAAPVAVFAYSRPDALRRAMAALRQCRGIEAAPVYLFIDGPRGAADAARVEAVRQFARGLGWANLELRIAEGNRGLRRSIMAGVTELVETYGEVIAVEDDLLLAPAALDYFRAGLERFGKADRVKAVCGYMFRMAPPACDRAAFLPFASSWGWATWRSAWLPFVADAERLAMRADEPAFRRALDRQGVIAGSAMLRAQRDGVTDSWASLWNAYLVETDGLALFPAETLVLNDGFATQGATHASRLNPINPLLRRLNQGRGFARSFSLPETVAVDEARQKEVAASLEARLHRLSVRLGTTRRRLLRRLVGTSA